MKTYFTSEQRVSEAAEFQNELVDKYYQEALKEPTYGKAIAKVKAGIKMINDSILRCDDRRFTNLQFIQQAMKITVNKLISDAKNVPIKKLPD